MSSRGLDGIARELAAGEISRRSALKRLAGAGLGIGALAAPAGVAEAMGGGCPPGRKKCGKKCCTKNARCQNGRCKCKPGFKKCGKKCVDTDTSVKHCGACGNACGDGETCVDGACDDGQTCGNDTIEGSEVCDGNDLGGEDCVSQGFIGGTLACANDCLALRHERLHAGRVRRPGRLPARRPASASRRPATGGSAARNRSPKSARGACAAPRSRARSSAMREPATSPVTVPEG